MTERRCEAELCFATEDLVRDLTGYFHCMATAGDATFIKCQDCLARVLLTELEHPAATLAELQQNISLLKSTRP